MKIGKRTNRICLGLTIATLVGIFMYHTHEYCAGYEAGFRDEEDANS
jgi:hypothetical protein